MDGILYYHATIANAYVYQDADGALWQVPMQPRDGWRKRTPYHHYRQALREIGPNQQRVLARSVGIPVDDA